MNKIEFNLVRMLIAQDLPIASEHLANKLQVSSRTIKRYIKNLNQNNNVLKNKIQSSKNGYLLLLNDEEKIELELELNKVKKNEDIGFSILYYLFTHTYASIDEISDSIYSNRNTVNVKIKELRNKLKDYNLKILTKNKFGIYIHGQETDKIRCFVETYHHNDFYLQDFLQKLSQNRYKDQMFYEIITLEFSKQKIIKSEEEIKLLEKYLLVYLIRNEKESYSFNMDGLSVNMGILIALENIIDTINDKLQIKLDKTLKYRLATIFGENFLPSDDCKKLNDIILKTLRYLEINYNESFSDNVNLIQSLYKHIKATCQRLRLNIHLENPLTESIKFKYYMSFEYATILMKNIGNAFQYTFLEDDIAYAALHFEVNSEKKKENDRRKILIVCNNGVGTSTLLKAKLTNQFPRLEVIDIIPAYMVNTYPLDCIDFIITTTPFETKIEKKVIVVNPILSNKDIQNITDYIKVSISIQYIKSLFRKDSFGIIELTSKEQVMSMLTKELLEKDLISVEQANIINTRENEYPTEIGHMCAIPHCLIDGKSFLKVFILKHPIIWKNEMVKIFFFGGINPKELESKKIFRYINKKISNEKTWQELCSCQKYEDFKKTMLC